MQVRRLWLVAVVVIAGACTTDTSSMTTVPSTSTTSSTTTTTTLPTTTTTTLPTTTTTTLPTTTTTVAPQTTTTLALPDEPRVSAGWSLQAGDFLVSNAQGVAVIREGVVVSQPVMSPVEAALAEGTGAILFVTPDPELFPAHWPERGKGGGYVIWRLKPDGTLTNLLRTDFTIDGPLGAITLYQAPVIGEIAPGHTTPILTTSGAEPFERILLAPAGNLGGAGLGIPFRTAEGGITGVGWQESDNRLIVAVGTDNGGWLEAWDFDDPIPVNWPSEWPTNPVPPDTPCPDDPSFNHCLDSVTTLPGTTLIAYTETDSLQSMTNLVIFDTETGTEVRRLLVAERPTAVKRLHASTTQVAVSLITYPNVKYQYVPTIVLDVETGTTETLPVGGVTTLVP
ncbi:MAG: hypothetical protein KKE89_02010 [Actinobacteria bacterium]|nr:hypothetical protein [Actinomycetota bacterium]